MPLDAVTLLDGPRGRRLCLELLLAHTGDPRTERERRGAQEAVLLASRLLDPNPGTLLRIGSGGDAVQPVVTAAEAARALAVLPLPSITPRALRDALVAAVDHARYWQEPDGHDVLAATPEVRGALERVAAAVAASPHAQWWATGVASGDQWAVPWSGGSAGQDAVTTVLDAWRDALLDDEERAAIERPDDPTASWSGTWWSMPPGALVHSTRDPDGAGPAGMWFVEDSLGWTSVHATPVHPASANVIEIDGPDAWIELCRRHPLGVTASRRHDWYRVTGWTGEWVQPDWASVARGSDGVHLPVAGYLATATRLLDLGDGRASVLAGWGPDETYWFARTLAGGPGREWTRVEDEWRPKGRGRGAEASGDSV